MATKFFLWFCDLANFSFWLVCARELFDLLLASHCLLIFRRCMQLIWFGHSLEHAIRSWYEYMFDVHVPLLLRLMSLFHLITHHYCLWGVWKLGYDKRGWKYQTLTAWIVVPICYFWRGQYDINWARGLFGRDEHILQALSMSLGI